MAIKYNSCLKVSNAMHDNNSCAVIALATATQTPHKQAYKTLEKLGRKHKDGTYTHQSLNAIEQLGFKYERVNDDYPTAKTPISAVKVLPKNKTFMVRVSGHIFTIRNGVVEDWTDGRKHRIIDIWEVKPTQSKNAKRKAKRYGK